MIDLNLGTDLIFCRSDLYIRGHGFGKDKAIKELDTGSSSKFRCKVCEKGLAKSHFLRHHVLVDHRDNCCDECDEYFGNLEMLCKHIKAIHLEEDRTCVVCSERFDTTESVEQHIRLFHPISLSEEQQNDGVTNLNNIDSSIPPKQDNDYSPKKKFRTEDNSQSGQLYEPNEKYSASIQSKENVSTTSRIAGKKGVKILTKEILESEVEKSGGGITIKKVECDLDKSTDKADGPWEDRNSIEVTIHYSMIGQENLNPRSINLTNLLKRGFPKCLASKRFKYYSWLRFKYYANEVSTIDSFIFRRIVLATLEKGQRLLYLSQKC